MTLELVGADRPRRRRSVALEQRTAANPKREPHWSAPPYVWACHDELWQVHLWSRIEVGRHLAIPYRCNSRHHPGPCRDTWRRKLHARLSSPLSQLSLCDPRDAMFWTLTLDHRVRSQGREEANRMLGKLWRSMWARLRKHLWRREMPLPEYFWIREAHRDGNPHLHLLVVHRGLASMLRVRDHELLGHSEVPEDDRTLAPKALRDMAVAAGFGVRFDAQLARNRQALCGYASKILTERDDHELVVVDRQRLAGEVSKGSQVPEVLPAKCRAYGSSRGFIPPRERTMEFEGVIRNEIGQRLDAHPKNYADAEARWELEYKRRAREAERKRMGLTNDDLIRNLREVIEARAKLLVQAEELALKIINSRDEQNPLHRLEVDIAVDYIASDQFHGPPTRAYAIRKPSRKFERNPKATPEEHVLAAEMGVSAHDDNPASQAARALRRAIELREQQLAESANDSGGETEGWSW